MKLCFKKVCIEAEGGPQYEFVEGGEVVRGVRAEGRVAVVKTWGAYKPGAGVWTGDGYAPANAFAAPASADVWESLLVAPSREALRCYNMGEREKRLCLYEVQRTYMPSSAAYVLDDVWAQHEALRGRKPSYNAEDYKAVLLAWLYKRLVGTLGAAKVDASWTPPGLGQSANAHLRTLLAEVDAVYLAMYPERAEELSTGLREARLYAAAVAAYAQSLPAVKSPIWTLWSVLRRPKLVEAIEREGSYDLLRKSVRVYVLTPLRGKAPPGLKEQAAANRKFLEKAGVKVDLLLKI
ncbi:MAG: hypothetical protein QW598_11135 [Pyrobaculum sp.]|uniref:hypothetical protein n=1 Tax=Pyrobaculum sp. TaxID=2004705 RepID=UPI003167BE77